MLKDPPDFTVNMPEMTSRNRLVIEYADEKDARQTAERLRDIGLPCRLEKVFIVSDGETGESCGEVVMRREFLAVAFTPIESA